MATRTRSLLASVLLALLVLYLFSRGFSSSDPSSTISYSVSDTPDISSSLEKPYDPEKTGPPKAPDTPIPPSGPEDSDLPPSDVKAEKFISTSTATTSITSVQPADHTKLLAPLWHHEEQDVALKVQDTSVVAKIQGAINQRIQHFAELILLAETPPGQAQRRAVLEIETFTTTLSPFLEPFLNSKKETVQVTSKEQTEIFRPWHSLRQKSEKGTKGILIPVISKTDFRQLLHLVASLRSSIKTALPIQVAFSGEKTLGLEEQNAVLSLGEGISLVDVEATFNLASTSSKTNRAASEPPKDIKSLAVLASPLEKIIILEPGVVVMSDPESYFANPDFRETGTYIFKSPNTNIYTAEERTAMHRERLQTPKALSKEAEAQRIAELQTEGLVVLDKSRVEVLTAVLVVAWQAFEEQALSAKSKGSNAGAYKMSWREAFESCTIPYSYSAEIAIVGSGSTVLGAEAVCNDKGEQGVAFYDLGKGELMWYSQNLEKKGSFEVPGEWMTGVNATKDIVKGATCFVGGIRKEIAPNQKGLLLKSVEVAVEVDAKFANLIKKSFK